MPVPPPSSRLALASFAIVWDFGLAIAAEGDGVAWLGAASLSNKALGLLTVRVEADGSGPAVLGVGERGIPEHLIVEWRVLHEVVVVDADLIRENTGEPDLLLRASSASGEWDRRGLSASRLLNSVCEVVVGPSDGDPVVAQDGFVEVAQHSNLGPIRNPSGFAVWREKELWAMYRRKESSCPLRGEQCPLEVEIMGRPLGP